MTTPRTLRPCRILGALALVSSFLSAAARADGDANRFTPQSAFGPIYVSADGADPVFSQWNGHDRVGEVAVVDINRLRGRPDVVRAILGAIYRGDLPRTVIKCDKYTDTPYRIVDVDGDGRAELITPDEDHGRIEHWVAGDGRWTTQPFPVSPSLACWGVLRDDGAPSIIVRSTAVTGAWDYVNGEWVTAPHRVNGLDIDGQRVMTELAGLDRGVRLRDLDGDGRCELIVSNPQQSAMFKWDDSATPSGRWRRLPIAPPTGVTLVDDKGRDIGLRWVNLHPDDGSDAAADIIVSNEKHYAVYLFQSLSAGWSDAVVSGDGNAAARLMPPIAIAGKATGAWFDADALVVRTRDDDERTAQQTPLSPLRAAMIVGDALPGYAEVVRNDGEHDSWWDYRGRKSANYFIRQTKAGTRLAWRTSPVPGKLDHDTVRFCFVGAIGYRPQPVTDGFALFVNGNGPVRFDVTDQPTTWSNNDTGITLRFVPTFSDAADAAGFFFVSVPRRLVQAGQPCELAVQSLGSGSRRWFAIHPIADPVGALK